MSTEAAIPSSESLSAGDTGDALALRLPSTPVQPPHRRVHPTAPKRPLKALLVAPLGSNDDDASAAHRGYFILACIFGKWEFRLRGLC